MSKQKKQLKRLMLELEKNSISLDKFLATYYGIYNNEGNKIYTSHKNISIMIPELKRVSFNYLLKNKEDLYLGKVITVRDSFGNLGLYIKPNFIINGEQNYNSSKVEKIEKIVEEIVIDENLSRYELACLCKKLKQEGRFREYYAAYRLLKIKKGSSVKTYTYKKNENIKMEE